MFFKLCSPMLSKAQSSCPWSCTMPETQIAPGSAIPSSRAAMLTPLQ